MENGGADTSTALVQVLRNLPVQALAGGQLMKGLAHFTPGMLGLRPMELKVSYDDKSFGQLRLGQRLFPDGIDVVFLKADPYRILHEGTGKDRHVVCASVDGWRPMEELQTPKAERCNRPLPSGEPTAVCDYAKRDQDPLTQKWKPSPCSAAIALLGLTAMPGESPQPFWFANGSISSVIPTRGLLYELSSLPGAELCRFRIHVATETRKAPGGGRNYYPPLYSVVETLSDDLFAAYMHVTERVAEIRYTPFVPQELLEDEEAGTVDITPQPAGGAAGGAADDSLVPF